MPTSIGKMLSVFFVSLLLSINVFAQCPSVQAYSGSSLSGNQNYNERLGMVFSVTSPITVTHLGAYDDGQNGLALPITVGIVRRSDGFVFAGPITLSGSGDPLSGLHRIQSIPDVVLPVGQYVIVAVGYGAGEQNGNSNIGGYPVSFTNAGGNLTFDEALFGGGVTFGLPTTSFPTPNAFHAGTFRFSEIPVAPQLEANPDESVVCAGDVITADITSPGENGQGVCVDEYRFSVDNGVNWSPWNITVPAILAVGGSTNIIESRRNCDSGACLSDTFSVSWLVTAPITSLSITAVPDGDVCIGATNVQYNAIVTGGTGPFSFAWCAYNNGTGTLPCFNGFNNNSIQNPTRTWNATTGPKSVGVTVSQDGCPDVQDLYVFEVESDPVRPALDMATPGTGIVVCQGSTVSATFLPGSGGAGNCVDEYRYSIDNGSTWNPYIPGEDITAGSLTVILQSRRLCDGLGCDGPGETFQNVFSWPVSLNPTVDISPDPAEVCAGIDLQLNGNPSGGSGIYSSHAWYGSGYEYLNDDEIVNPVFNHDVPGQFAELIYSVTDNLGCSANDTITITVLQNPIASILPATIPDFICPGKNLLLNGNPSGGDGNYTHQWEDASNFNDATVQSAVFNSLVLGNYTVTYTVTDGNGCTGTDEITFTVGDEVDPQITCPANVTVDTDPGICTSLFEYEVLFSDNCSGLDVVGFENEFAPVNWVLSNSNAGDGSVDESLAPSSITLTGSNTAFNPGSNNTDYCITIPGTTSGVVTFDWSYTTFDSDGSFWDRFGYVVDGTFTQLSDEAGPANQMGSITIPLIPNQEFCFRIYSDDQLFGAAVTITMNFGYMENINPMLNQTLGLSSGSDFPLGVTTNTFVVTDFAGNENSCTFTVTVEDNENPVALCPDNIEVQLDPLECGRIVDFVIDGTDNCSIFEIRQIKGLPTGSFFPIGKDTITFVVEDGSENTDTCSFTVLIIDFQHPPLGCIPIHLSLDENCEGIINPLNVLTGYLGDEGEINLGCLDCFKINVKAPNGTNLGDKVNGTYLGKTLDYHITNTKTGFNCWNTVLIEDKIKPTIECRNDTISCMAPLSAAKVPLVFDNCYARLVKLDERFEKLECDPIAIGRYVRTWKAVDDYGNESVSCNDTVYLRRTDLTGLVFPDHKTLSCSEGYATDSKGFPYPSPTITGVPSLNGIELYPFQNSFICNGAITYNDQLILNTPCKKRIIRTWSITEWWCSTTVIYNMPFQIIDILDTIPPAIPTVADITVTTKTRSCDADVILPALNITDNCTEVKLVVVNATLNGVPSGTVTGNGGLIKLSVGTHRIEYTAIDACGNTSKRHYFITVKDNTSPLAICDQLNTVSLNSNGYAEVSASSVDDGSFDECGPVTLQIQRTEDPCGTGQNTGWHNAVSFCCEDAHQTRMVILLVTDGGGNTNMCMVSVQVQDKINPVITCPPHQVVENCTFTFDPDNAGVVFGYADVKDNCPSTINVREVLQDGRTNCGIGLVTRTFTALVNGAVHGSCIQNITFSNNNPFDGYNTDHVIWPKDTTITGSCSPLDLLPEALPTGYGAPIIVEDACDLVGLTHKDEVYYFANNNACWKILRYWTIIDWCQIGSDGKYLTWTYEQEIKVVDTVAPAITSPTTDRMQCITDSSCEGGIMTGLIATANDCTPDSMLQWSYIIYNTDVNPETIHKTGHGNDVSGYYPLGKYRVAFEVLDRCGNISNTGFNFEMRNCKKPTPVCKQNLSTTLTMMPDGNGGMVPQVMVEASFFDNKSYHPCKYPVAISFSADTLDRVRTFTCLDTAGLQRLEIWVTDINGNSEFCVSFLDVQDSLNICGSGRIVVQGTIMTDNEVEVESVKVDINNGEGSPSYTDKDGQYIFEGLPSGSNYTFTPKKDGDDKNGISTLDVVMIQRHILGMQKIESPYRLIAADVNNSGNISAADLLELRKLILGVYDELPQSDSWRFVDGMYTFPEPSNPWIGHFPEHCALQQLVQDATVNFVAIKVGDVNGSAVGNQLNPSSLESRSTFSLNVENVRLIPGQSVRIPVRASDDALIYGLQIMLNTRWSSDMKIIPAAIQVKDSEIYWLPQNKLGLSVSVPSGQQVKAGDIMFYIETKSVQSGNASDMLSVNTSVRPEIYTEGMNEEHLSIEWRNTAVDEFKISGVQPNPWNAQTFIDVFMPESSMVSFKVKDASGRKVVSRVEYLNKGNNSIVLSADELGTAGVYFFEIRFEHSVHTGKMIMID